MTTATAFLVLAAPLAFGTVALLAVAHRGLRPTPVQRLGTLATWLGVAVAAAAGGFTIANGLIESTTIGGSGLGLSIRLDPLSTIMFAMITLLAVIIFRYSVTYLDGDGRQGVFLGRLAATFAAVELLVLSGNLATLVVAWVATSLALHELLTFYPNRRRAIIAARKKFIAARVGDAFLILAAIALYREFNTGNLEEIFAGVRAAGEAGWAINTITLASLALVMAALLKSAQFPTHGWLVEVMETPTPVSALLHAGILNAGPFLAIRMAYVVNDSAPASALLITAGATTAVFASIVLLTQPSVKVGLGYSSVAHMGFMLLVCGLGVFPAALLHLVAHSFYKAHAFLSSASAIDEERAAKVSIPKRLGSPARIVGSFAIAIGLYAVLAAAWDINPIDDPAILAIGAIFMLGTTQIVAPALDSAGTTAATLRASALALGVTTSFFALESATHHLLGETVPHNTASGVILLTLTAAVVIAFATVIVLQILEPARTPSRRRRAVAIHLRNGLYANAVFDRAVGALHIARTNPATVEVTR